MDSLYNSGNHKLNTAGNISSLMIPPRGRFSSFSPQESLIKYLCSNSPSSGSSSSGKRSYRSPLSSLSENTQVRLEEDDVLIMDEIAIGSNSGFGGSESSSPRFGGFHNTEICRAWKDLENCLYGSKCQFAHGKEELRPTRFQMRNSSEAQMCKAYASTGSRTYGQNCRFIHPVMMDTTAMISQMDLASRPAHTSQNPSTIIKPEETSIASISPAKPATNPFIPYSTIKTQMNKSPASTFIPEFSLTRFTSAHDWSPLDDGIDISLPFQPDKTPSRKDIDSYINNVLYGPAKGKRLPVFAEIVLSNDPIYLRKASTFL